MAKRKNITAPTVQEPQEPCALVISVKVIATAKVQFCIGGEFYTGMPGETLQIPDNPANRDMIKSKNFLRYV